MKESPLFAKTHDLLLWLLPATTKWPRTQRHLLSRRVQDAALDFHDHLLRGGLDVDGRRSEHLGAADVELARLRAYLRLCHELGFLGHGQYEHVARMVSEVGRLLGAWRRSQGGLG
jgi:hypothetical protein